MAEQIEVGVIGAGLSGLACAVHLQEHGVACTLFDGAPEPGGRVRTDEQEGYLLDRGFQILLSSYPEARRVLDFDALEARPFDAGSLVQVGSKAWRVTDPWRSPVRGLGSILAPFVTLGDGLKLAKLRSGSVAASLRPGDVTAGEYLRQLGFSDELRERFFRPFFAGITLDPELGVPAHYLVSLFGWFSTGKAVLPRRGMRALPEQLAAGLPPGSVRFGEKVRSIRGQGFELEGGGQVEARALVAAVDAHAAAELFEPFESRAWSGTTTVYYAAESSPVGGPWLVLNGEGRTKGPVNHLCVPSDVQPSYAPQGSSLLSISLVGVPDDDDRSLDQAVRTQLRAWYGGAVDRWQLLRVDRIERALPRFARGETSSVRDGVHLCGDYLETPSIQGALVSGRRAAEAVLAQLGVAAGPVT